ncbi:MBL fold metallo-hydrolase [candidate division KSB1 bacterium]
MKHNSLYLVLIIVFCLPMVFCSSGDDVESSELVQPSDWWEKLPRPVYSTLEKVDNSQWWFEVYRLPNDIYAIYEPFQFEEAIGYLVTGTDRAVIIDTGTGIGDLKKLIDELTGLPYSVLNTHTHYDHVGDNHQFSDIAMLRDADGINRLIEGRTNESLLNYLRPALLRRGLPEEFDPGSWTIPSVEPTYLFDDGTIIDLGERTLEVIHTPGHCSDEVCFLDKENRILFTGDMFFPGPLYAFGDDVNIDDYIASIKKLEARLDEYDYLCSGHNNPWVKSEVITRVRMGFEDVMAGKGEFNEQQGVRRYFFDGFDILIRADMIK